MQQTSKICIHTPPLNVQCGQCWEILSSAQMNCRRKSSLTTTSGVVEVLASITADFCLQIVQSHHLKDLQSSTFTANGKWNPACFSRGVCQDAPLLSAAESVPNILGFEYTGRTSPPDSITASHSATALPNSAAFSLSKTHTKSASNNHRTSSQTAF